ncbi:hypothetical protein [Citreimonas salinaria]|uniref:Uncharacterized protein n=1 Tax=Citreimonas salinaria TaxID=321339 RepID=A0A1H3NV39_9RHOB|nr:hypothetical protein [Citreimonas salinaria]SDY92811.1 hypothetical protein SAMN05444340_1338 [Citreimonas salinaria]
MRLMIRTAAALAAFLIAAPLAAQETALPEEPDSVLGSITGTLDLRPAEWRVMENTEGGGSHWSREEATLSVRMDGILDGVGDASRLVISFDLAGPESSVVPTDIYIALTHPDFDEPLVAMGDDISLEITAVTQLSDDMVIAGGVNALLQVPGSESDENDVTLDGNFQVTLPREEDEA